MYIEIGIEFDFEIGRVRIVGVNIVLGLEKSTIPLCRVPELNPVISNCVLIPLSTEPLQFEITGFDSGLLTLTSSNLNTRL